MQITKGKYAGEALKFKSPVKEWRESPGDLTAACVAARYYADRDGERKIVVPGNSYGARSMNIVNEGEDLRKFTVIKTEVRVMIVYPGGKVYQGIAS